MFLLTLFGASYGKKIFVSYKYSDGSVENLIDGANSTVIDYVNCFEKKLDSSDNIYKGESDGEDLSEFSDDTIWEKLKNRIYDSSVTIVFISPDMKDPSIVDRDQWIPWEISYSLKETSRKTKKGDPVTSHTNAMLAVVIPDTKGSYSYYLEEKSCCSSKCTCHHVNILFDILRKNKFNRKNAEKHKCDNNDTVWTGTCSYIEAVKWSDFIENYQKYVSLAVERQEHIDEYDICNEV